MWGSRLDRAFTAINQNAKGSSIKEQSNESGAGQPWTGTSRNTSPTEDYWTPRILDRQARACGMRDPRANSQIDYFELAQLHITETHKGVGVRDRAQGRYGGESTHGYWDFNVKHHTYLTSAECVLYLRCIWKFLTEDGPCAKTKSRRPSFQAVLDCV
jgi:hypothetical protein